MTDSMIPYSFVPGTKAKADEVNANLFHLQILLKRTKRLLQVMLKRLIKR